MRIDTKPHPLQRVWFELEPPFLVLVLLVDLYLGEVSAVVLISVHHFPLVVYVVVFHLDLLDHNHANQGEPKHSLHKKDARGTSQA